MILLLPPLVAGEGEEEEGEEIVCSADGDAAAAMTAAVWVV